MTLEEAHAWLEAHIPDANDFAIEWLGREWTAYQWIGPAGEDYEVKRTSFIECVEWVKEFVEKRNAGCASGSP